MFPFFISRHFSSKEKKKIQELHFELFPTKMMRKSIRFNSTIKNLKCFIRKTSTQTLSSLTFSNNIFQVRMGFICAIYRFHFFHNLWTFSILYNLQLLHFCIKFNVFIVKSRKNTDHTDQPTQFTNINITQLED